MFAEQLQLIWKVTKRVLLALGVILLFIVVIEIIQAFQILSGITPLLGCAFVLVVAGLVQFASQLSGNENLSSEQRTRLSQRVNGEAALSQMASFDNLDKHIAATIEALEEGVGISEGTVCRRESQLRRRKLTMRDKIHTEYVDGRSRQLIKSSSYSKSR